MRRDDSNLKNQGNAIFVFQVTSSLFVEFGGHNPISAGDRNCVPRIPPELALQAVFSDRGLRSLSLYGAEFLTPLCHGLDTLRRPQRAAERFEALKTKLLGRLNGVAENMAWREFDLRGQPEFHVRVWEALHAIPFGQTATYGEIAKAVGSPRASRACGQACGANPILLFIPCHRVVSSSGLGGFGCGVEWKKRFLALEGVDWRRLPGHAAHV